MSIKPTWPVYGYSAYGRHFRIEQPVDGAYLVTVHDCATGALIDFTTVTGSEHAATTQVHRYENEAMKTGAKR
jgi:hypothetical protein